MKEYLKPNIISERILEKTALACQDTNYYVRATYPCYDTFIGTGKADSNCYKLSS
jgi:hypothetical protein